MRARATPIQCWAGARLRGGARASLRLPQAPSGAIWRIHPAAVQVVHRNAEHSAGRLQPGHAGAALVRVAGAAHCTQHLLRRLVWRGTGRTVFRPAQAPTVLVNFSNIGWFGNTLAVDQHLQISRMRALELERPMVRATNTGPLSSLTTVGGHACAGALQPGCFARRSARARAGVSGGAAITPFAWWASRWGCGRCGCLPAWVWRPAGWAGAADNAAARRLRLDAGHAGTGSPTSNEGVYAPVTTLTLDNRGPQPGLRLHER